MNDTNANAITIEAQPARDAIWQAHFKATRRVTRPYPAYIGMDVHKDTIVVAVASDDFARPQDFGEIANKPKAIAKLVERLCLRYDGQVLMFCYEAGPCGYRLYRQILALGHDCLVVAPSLIPKAPGDRVKTDRRDARKLAQLLRSNSLSGICVPDEEQEAIRDLTRARDDFKKFERLSRQQLSGFLLRHAGNDAK